MTHWTTLVNEGDRIAQLILERIYTPDIMEVQVRQLATFSQTLSLTTHQELDETLRGAGGFGSTGGHKAL